jgi:hypothetical protein
MRYNDTRTNVKVFSIQTKYMLQLFDYLVSSPHFSAAVCLTDYVELAILHVNTLTLK